MIREDSHDTRSSLYYTIYPCSVLMLDQQRIRRVIEDSIDTKRLVIASCLEDIERCGNLIAGAYRNNCKMMLCGNGGSAADAQHIAAELVIRFRGSVNRRALPALALTVDPSMQSAGGNDLGFDKVFARGVEAYGQPGDVLVGISTSGNSANVLEAVLQAKQMGIITIGLLGNGGGRIAEECDANVIIPSSQTARIQESHIMVGHIWCEQIEESLFPELFE